ncbi:MAG: TadE/TadG family type IV pilus assembly protein [Cypionkella sp.]
MPAHRRRPLPGFVRRLAGDSRGVSLIEFAYILPVFITLGMVGAEVAWMASVNMQVSQVALSLADNASRLGQSDNSSVTPTITEADVDSIMSGALRQGAAYNLATRGRVILSSVEYDKASGKQFIHWQRCRGTLARTSAYGNDGARNGLTGTSIAGVGQAAQKVRAADGSAVMVAEVFLEYQSLFAGTLTGPKQFRQEAVFAIRDDRNLAPGVTGGSGQSRCT